jgi:hypothetical protein
MARSSELVDPVRERATSSELFDLSRVACGGVSRAQVIAANERLGAAIARLERLEAIEFEWLREAVRVARLGAEAFAEHHTGRSARCA